MSTAMTGSDDVLAGPPWRLNVAGLARTGASGEVEADVSERAEIAAALDLIALDELLFAWWVTPMSRSRWRLKGTLRCRAVQACVVTLEPVPDEIVEEVTAIFIPDVAPRSVAEDVAGRKLMHKRNRAAMRAPAPPPKEIDFEPDEENVEPIVSGQIRMGGLVYETLAVSLDPYPRVADAELAEAGRNGAQDSNETDDADAPADNPFRKLARLRNKQTPRE